MLDKLINIIEMCERDNHRVKIEYDDINNIQGMKIHAPECLVPQTRQYINLVLGENVNDVNIDVQGYSEDYYNSYKSMVKWQQEIEAILNSLHIKYKVKPTYKYVYTATERRVMASSPIIYDVDNPDKISNLVDMMKLEDALKEDLPMCMYFKVEEPSTIRKQFIIETLYSDVLYVIDCSM
ncbi:MAG: hypothetical protein ATN35_10540 [Epulopiscium sp. Nele67-Bin004]|nr:MAG: hypothetical protein ATN35_10540 [Epulopiscium sp. Nele67-Bin004]